MLPGPFLRSQPKARIDQGEIKTRLFGLFDCLGFAMHGGGMIYGVHHRGNLIGPSVRSPRPWKQPVPGFEPLNARWRKVNVASKSVHSFGPRSAAKGRLLGPRLQDASASSTKTSCSACSQ